VGQRRAATITEESPKSDSIKSKKSNKTRNSISIAAATPAAVATATVTAELGATTTGATAAIGKTFVNTKGVVTKKRPPPSAQVRLVL
jgi:hypothetical protein